MVSTYDLKENNVATLQMWSNTLKERIKNLSCQFSLKNFFFSHDILLYVSLLECRCNENFYPLLIFQAITEQLWRYSLWLVERLEEEQNFLCNGSLADWCTKVCSCSKKKFSALCFLFWLPLNQMMIHTDVYLLEVSWKINMLKFSCIFLEM